MNGARPIRKAAVLGAGVMGAQIAAHLANAEIQVLLFELPDREGSDPNAPARRAVEQLRKLDPQPLASPGRLELIRPVNYEEHLEALRGCDLVIEAIAERLDLKTGLFSRIAPFVGDKALLTSNTSGLSVAELSRALPEGLRSRFCGMHFFNPPRYMHLVELIPAPQTHNRVLDRLETFLVSRLGKGVVRAKDTPNFIANRVGVFSLAATLIHAQRLDLAPETVDALTGALIGRPKSATYRTADVVGLDTLAHVVDGSREWLKDDPWRDCLTLPDWLRGLVERGALGQKRGEGVYRKKGKEIMVWDPTQDQYRPSRPEVDPDVEAILKIDDPPRRFLELKASDHPQAQFLWAIHRDVFHYAAYHLAEIADTTRDVDLGLRWGFGWQHGPFEIWQAAGWRQVTEWIEEDINHGQTLAPAPLPVWVREVKIVHGSHGSWSPARNDFVRRRALPVYDRQRFPETVLGEPAVKPGETLWENDGVRLWDGGNGIGILGFKSRMHVIGAQVMDGIQQALEQAEANLRGVVLWHEAPFSAGANLKEAGERVQREGPQAMLQLQTDFQHTALRLRDSTVPVVAAIQGLALGGGCEFLMHCDRRVAALESYIGLVEAGVGLIPGGGGCKEAARRAALEARGGDLLPFLRRRFEAMAKAQVAKSAEEAREMGYLDEADIIVFNPHELLHVAHAQALALAESGYRPPLPRLIPVAGRDGLATFKLILINMKEGGFISEHDLRVAERIAWIICGGDVDPGTRVSEDWLLHLEREAFQGLAATDKTQARIQHTLTTGKPLRN